MGLMQFMPGTARSYGINALDPRQAIDGAARYFKHLLSLFGGDQAKAIAGYNAGEGAVQKYGGIPPYAETQHYVTAVLASEKKYGGNGSNAPATIDTPPAATAPAAFGLPGGAEITATLTKVLITGTAVAAGAGLVLLGLNRATGNPAGKATKAAVDVAL
jgi:hypothetical protein